MLCERPRRLKREEAVEWLRKATASLEVGEGGVKALQLVELDSPSLRWARCWDWLLEVELASDVDANELVSHGPWGDLLADLRLLGMRPAVAIANPARTTQLGGAS